jgi:hypothetical protein
MQIGEEEAMGETRHETTVGGEAKIPALIVVPEAIRNSVGKALAVRRAVKKILYHEYAELAAAVDLLDYAYFCDITEAREKSLAALRSFVQARPGISHAFHVDIRKTPGLSPPEISVIDDLAGELHRIGIPSLPVGMSFAEGEIANGAIAANPEYRTFLAAVSSLPIVLHDCAQATYPQLYAWTEKQRGHLAFLPGPESAGEGEEQGMEGIDAASAFFKREGFCIDSVFTASAPKKTVLFVMHSQELTAGEKVVFLFRLADGGGSAWVGLVRRITAFIPQTNAGARHILVASLAPRNGENDLYLSAHVASAEYFEELSYLLGEKSAR